jgi:hypothetical protein
MNDATDLFSAQGGTASFSSGILAFAVPSNQKDPQIIIIEPANPQVVYVPTYNPTVVYGVWAYPAYPPYPVYPPGYVATTAAFSFATGVAGSAGGQGDAPVRTDHVLEEDLRGDDQDGGDDGQRRPGFTGRTARRPDRAPVAPGD